MIACNVHACFYSVFAEGERSVTIVQTAAAGMMINTMGWVEDLGFQLLLHTITAMHANIVLVVGQDRLLRQLQATYQVLLQPLE